MVRAISCVLRQSKKVLVLVLTSETADEDFQPTARAFQEHIAALKSRAKGEVSTNTTPKNRAAATPRSGTKRGVANTPSSSNKRAKLQNKGAEDEPEDDLELDTPSDFQRRTPSRRSKTMPKRYLEPDDEDEDQDDHDDKSLRSDTEIHANGKDESVHALTPGAQKSRKDSAGPPVDGVHGAGGRKARSKNDPPKSSSTSEDDSDASIFEPIE